MNLSNKSDKENIDDFMKSNNNIVYDVSVIIASYNPLWAKLKLTLDSIIVQKDVAMQIIVADDGSEDNLFNKVSEYFIINGFNNYKLISSEENKGTVANFLKASMEAEGKYIKGISPGDCLYKSDTLHNWISSLRGSGKKWSFADAVYYNINENIPQTIILDSHPQHIYPYLQNNDVACRWNYVVLDDIALGAAILCERTILIEYLKRIEGKVKYAEDNIWRMMMFDGVIGFYYNDVAIVYEYGTGVSTSGNEIWYERLREDWRVANIEMLNKAKDKFQEKMAKAVMHRLENRNIISALFIKGKLKLYIRKKLFPRKTPNIDVSKLSYFNQQEEG